MIKLRTYAAVSLIATMAVVYHSFNSRSHFYPAMVYLSTSKISLVLILNMGLVIMCTLWQLTKKTFLGSLREAEIERLNEQSWREIMEILFAITIFRQDFSITFLGLVTALLLIKSLHWLAQKRVEYIETTPSVPMISHVRIVTFMGFLLLIDSLFLYDSVKYLLETRQASVSLFFSFEYLILATSMVATFVKYIFYVSDMIMEGQWENKAVYTFYLELVRDLLHLTMYMCFFLVIFANYGVPLHLIRELYETFRNFKIRVADYIRYRRITSNMNDRFPDATSEELNVSDATCIICREEMNTAKKLICGHLFHVHCLRSWLERQNTCPTCRAPVVPLENGTPSTGSRADVHQQHQGTRASSQDSTTREGTGNINGSQHQYRLQAATAAASVYQKSFVYPNTSTLMWSPGYASLSQTFRHSENADGANEVVGASTTISSQHQFSNATFSSLFQSPFIPSQFSGFGGVVGSGSESESQLDLQRKLIENQIEILQSHLRHLHAVNGKKPVDLGVNDEKGKSASSPSSSDPSSSETGKSGCTA